MIITCGDATLMNSLWLLSLTAMWCRGMSCQEGTAGYEKLPHFSTLKQIIHVFAGHAFSLSKWHAQDWAAQQKITMPESQGKSTQRIIVKGGRVTALELHPRAVLWILVAVLPQRSFSFTAQFKIPPAGAHACPLGEMHPSHLPTLPWQLSCLLGVTHTPFPAEQGNYTGFHTTSSKLQHSNKNPLFCKAGFLQQTCQ